LTVYLKITNLFIQILRTVYLRPNAIMSYLCFFVRAKCCDQKNLSDMVEKWLETLWGYSNIISVND